jgi:aspartyl/glutamyl-tRNA(Asn/Gln) amidotransferase B subunit
MAAAAREERIARYEPVIGLEVHCQLLTQTKLFCGCRNHFGDEPNTHVCPVCLGLPGALPVLNHLAVTLAMRAALATHCTVQETSIFARKNYFYPDLPKAYQISQYDEPLCTHGRLEVPTPGGEIVVGIHRAHLEEDAAKNVHVAASGRIHGATATLVDFNRCGTPLLEIVTEPDLHSADDAKRFLQVLRQTVVELGLSDAELEKGSMRFDVNVSMRPAGSGELRTRTELKNMNSFNFAAKGIDNEVRRQITIYESGGTVEQETLHFDPASGSLTATSIAGCGFSISRRRPRRRSATTPMATGSLPRRSRPRLYGAANARFKDLQTTMADEVAFWMKFREQYVPPARERIGATASEKAEGEGLAMGWQQALESAFRVSSQHD